MGVVGFIDWLDESCQLLYTLWEKTVAARIRQHKPQPQKRTGEHTEKHTGPIYKYGKAVVERRSDRNKQYNRQHPERLWQESVDNAAKDRETGACSEACEDKSANTLYFGFYMTYSN